MTQNLLKLNNGKTNIINLDSEHYKHPRTISSISPYLSYISYILLLLHIIQQV